MNEHHDAQPEPKRLFGGRTLARASLEVFSIVLGVLLALAVSEWQENRNNQERTAAALRNVRAELARNLRILEIVHSNNVAVVDRIADAPATQPQDEEFVPALQISDSAWETLGTTGLANFVEFDLMVTLSQTYSLMEVYRRAGYSLVDANMWVLAIATASREDAKNIDEAGLFATNFVDILQLIVSIEAALIDAHEIALASAGLPAAD
jgi:hypothetical protein